MGTISLVHRYYDPVTSQFLSVDPLVSETGMPYAFVAGDPVNGTDPLGLSWWNPASWSAKTWERVGVVAGGVALAATGVGALADTRG